MPAHDAQYEPNMRDIIAAWQDITQALQEVLDVRHSSPKRWLSLKEVSQYHASLSERTLRSYLGHPDHPLPAHFVGSGKWLVNLEDLDHWLRSFPKAGAEIDRLVDEVMTDLDGSKRYGQNS